MKNKKKSKEQLRNEAICTAIGHDFDGVRWIKKKKVTTIHYGEPGVRIQDGNYYPGSYDEEEIYWERTCKRCNAVEKQNTEPIDVQIYKVNKEIQNHEKQIKRLVYKREKLMEKKEEN